MSFKASRAMTTPPDCAAAVNADNLFFPFKDHMPKEPTQQVNGTISRFSAKHC